MKFFIVCLLFGLANAVWDTAPASAGGSSGPKPNGLDIDIKGMGRLKVNTGKDDKGNSPNLLLLMMNNDPCGKNCPNNGGGNGGGGNGGGGNGGGGNGGQGGCKFSAQDYALYGRVRSECGATCAGQNNTVACGAICMLTKLNLLDSTTYRPNLKAVSDFYTRIGLASSFAEATKSSTYCGSAFSVLAGLSPQGRSTLAGAIQILYDQVRKAVSGQYDPSTGESQISTMMTAFNAASTADKMVIKQLGVNMNTCIGMDMSKWCGWSKAQQRMMMLE